jgi:hypothetical protein
MLDDLLSNPWAYLPPKSSLWLWIGAPLILLLTYFVTSWTSGEERKKRLREADIWRASVGAAPAAPREDNKKGAPYRPDPAKKDEPAKPKKKPAKNAGPPRAAALPAGLHAALVGAGGGDPIVHYELVSGLAYLSLLDSNATAGSDCTTVTAKLEERGPTMTVHPLPIVDGVRVPNTGVQFKKDPELMKLFMVEGADARAVGKWLSRPIREALCEMPDVWLRVEGRAMTLTVYGSLEADRIDSLVELADAIFAEHGDEGGPSLFGDDSERPAASDEPPAAKKPRTEPRTATTLSETPVSKRRPT